MSHTIRTAGDTAPSKDGNKQDEVSKYLTVDLVVLEKELVTRNSESGRPESTSESGRREVPVSKIVDHE